MAETHGPFYTTSRDVTRLVRKGLVYRPARGRVAFTAPMFGAYIRRRRD